MNDLVPGCVINTPWHTIYYGECVLVETKEGMVTFRYPAIRVSDKKEIWVLHTIVDTDNEVFKLKDPTEETIRVSQLKGLYGLD